MPDYLRFPKNQVVAALAHAEAATSHREVPSDLTGGRAGLWLVADHGVWLRSNGDESGATKVYADTMNPQVDRTSWRDAQALVFDSAFSKFISADVIRNGLFDNSDKLIVLVREGEAFVLARTVSEVTALQAAHKRAARENQCVRVLLSPRGSFHLISGDDKKPNRWIEKHLILPPIPECLRREGT